MSVNSFQSYIEEEFQKRKGANPAYSLRAFSKKIGLSPSAFSEFRRGKRNLSPQSARKILLSLGTASDTVEGLVSGLYRRKFVKNKQLPRSQELMDEWTFKIISEWQYFAILSLLECDGGPWNYTSVAAKLSLPLAVVEASVDRLLQLGMAQKLANGTLLSTGKSFVSSDGIPSLAIQKFQRSILRQATVALEQEPLETRDFYTTTLAVNPKQIPVIRQLTREFHKKVAAVLETGEQTEVYTYSTQFFPLKNRNNNEK